MTYSFESAQANLAQLLSDAAEGKDVWIEREGGAPIRLAVAGAAQVNAVAGEREFGQDRGLVEYEDSALDPLSDQELAELGFGFLLEKKLVSVESDAQKAGCPF